MSETRLTAIAAAVVLLLAGCGNTSSNEESGGASLPDSTATPSAKVVNVTGAEWAHVHNLAYTDDRTLLLGTHEGLHRQEPGQQPVLLSETKFDVMGLANDGQRWLASGHPGEDENLPADLGLRTSPDGVAWKTVSLLGEVDFHRLTASGTTILGVSAHDGALLRSKDAGTTWAQLENPGVFDIALDPDQPRRAVATTQSGPILTSDAGNSWNAVTGAPVLALVAWTGDQVIGVTPDGTVHLSSDAGTTWQVRGDSGGQPAALAAHGQHIAVLVGSTVRESTDGGATFTDRISGIGGH